MFKKKDARADIDGVQAPNYYLTNREVDVISLALRDRILLLRGHIMMEQDFGKDELKLYRLKAELRDAETVQAATTYEGQPSFYKDEELAI